MLKLIKIYSLWIGISIPCQQTSERPQAKLNGEVHYPRLGFETATTPSGQKAYPELRIGERANIARFRSQYSTY
jgi:hypothetical protein